MNVRENPDEFVEQCQERFLTKFGAIDTGIERVSFRLSDFSPMVPPIRIAVMVPTDSKGAGMMWETSAMQDPKQAADQLFDYFVNFLLPLVENKGKIH